MGKPLWTPEQDAMLRNAYPTGTPAKELAKLLGKTPYAVNARVRRLELTSPAARRWTRQENRLLRSLLQQGQPMGRISKLLKRTPVALRTQMLKIGLAESAYIRKPFTAEHDRIIRDLWAQNVSMQQIAKTLHRAALTISRRAKALGLPPAKRKPFGARKPKPMAIQPPGDDGFWKRLFRRESR